MAAFVMLGRLLLAAACSGAIGYERETARKAAGLRTYTLVGVGAAVFSIASIISFDGPDQSRIAAQIVTGVGFLGAGAIFREGALVSGLTTAAGLWVVASIGMAAGAGSYWLAIFGTGVTVAVFYGLTAVDAAVARRKDKVPARLKVHIEDPSKLESLLKFIHRVDPSAVDLDFKRLRDGNAELIVGCNESSKSMLADMVASHKSVTDVEVIPALLWPHDSNG